MRVLANRELAGEEVLAGGQCDLRILFVDDTRGTCPQERPAGIDAWHQLPAGVAPQTRLRADGRLALVGDVPAGAREYSAAVRQVLPFAAALQGRLILHAAATLAPNGVHLFIGASGTGKSTIVKQLSRLGYRPIADDLVQCHFDGERALAVLSDDREKGSGRLTLAGIYFLSRRRGSAKLRCTRVDKGDCFVELLGQGFGELAVPEIWAVQFDAYKRIAESVAAFRLELSDDLALVDAALPSFSATYLAAESTS